MPRKGPRTPEQNAKRAAARAAKMAMPGAREAYNAGQRARYAADAVFAETVKARNRAWTAANLDKARAQKRRSRRVCEYGISGATGDAPRRACDLCREVKVLVCDHDHSTGHIRGWLCTGCNTALGRLGDTVEGLQRAVDYLIDARRRAPANAANEELPVRGVGILLQEWASPATRSDG